MLQINKTYIVKQSGLYEGQIGKIKILGKEYESYRCRIISGKIMSFEIGYEFGFNFNSPFTSWILKSIQFK